MHIVHIVDYFQPQIGYQEPLLAREHQRMGHRVTVVTSDRYFPYPNYDKVYGPLLGPRIVGIGTRNEEGITVVRLRTLLDIGGFVFCPGIPACLRGLKPDVVVHHGLLHPNFWMTGHAAFHSKWALVADSHMADYNTSTKGLFRRAYLALYRLLLGRFVRGRARVIAIGPCEQEFLRRVLPEVPSTIIPLAADGSLFSPPDPELRHSIRAELGFDADDIVLFHAGKFIPGKHTLELVRTFKRVAAQTPHLHLILVGGGDPEIEDAVNHELQAAPHIIRIPFSPREQLPRLMAAADIGVWPGPAPSIVFVEAMAMGLPLVLHRDIYGAFIVRAGNGLVVETDDELADALRTLATDPALRTAMSENARRLFREDFDSSTVANRFLDAEA